MNENTNLETMEEVTTVYETNPETVDSGADLVKVAVIAGGALLAGAAAFAVAKSKKIKAKLEEHQIKKLEKKGYLVYGPDEVVEDEDFVEHEEPIEETK